ncbi:MAG: GYDIA family GHMP kinase [Nonlabens sp.]|uniref:GYDIA family GHMP kinase n=1 Tax=Nonlabens sp. TaxID=1888209 RepID=UPI003EF90397
MNKSNHIKKYTAHGKFLITGEYAVLDNVPALAIPLQLNQQLEVKIRDDKMFSWKSYDVDGSLWFETKLTLRVLGLEVINYGIDNLDDKMLPIYGATRIVAMEGDDSIAIKLVEILRKAIELNPNAIEKIATGFEAVTTLDFNRKYGMGTSSTLISLVSQWLECDAYALQFECFGGSGYDIACATAECALIYNYNNAQPTVEFLDWNPAVKHSIFFIYLNKKQNSRDSIARFNSALLTDELRTELSEMPQRFIKASNNLTDFNTLINRHEAIISSLIGLEPVQQKLFPDYTGAIKSLGGWGGDFMMCTGGVEERNYFKSRGYEVLLEWDEVVA